jgi:hypothetical protein
MWRSSWDEACAVVYWSAFAWVVVARLAPSRADERPPPALAYAPFACALLLYFAMPFRLGGAAMLNVRLAPVVALLAVPLLAPAPGPAARGPLALAVMAALAAPAVSAFEMHRIDREEMVDIDAVLAPTQPGARLASLNFLVSSRRMHFPPWPHVGSYHRVHKGGVASWSFAELSHWSVVYRREAMPPHHPPFWEYNPCVYRNAEDGSYYDYLLVRGALDPFRDKPPGPAWSPLSHAGDFTLFGKTGETWPDWDTQDEGPCRARSEDEAQADP